MSRIADLRDELGGAHPAALTKIRDYLEPRLQAFIRHSPFLVMASANEQGDCDASPKGGKPGFVKVLDERTLLIPDIGGNRLFQGYENVERNSKIGLVFMIPGQESTVRVNGRVSVVNGADLAAQGFEPEVFNPDGNSGLVQALRLDIDEAYYHCPRAFKFADLWNTATIETNCARSLKDYV